VAKKVRALVKLQIVGGKASPAPPVGPALGQHGVNIMDFCKAYNAATQDRIDQVVPVELTVYEDRSFSYILKTAPAAVLIRQAAGIDKGASNPRKDKVGQITQEQLRQIAETKMTDLNALDVEGAMNIIAGTARSMGVTVAK
jgi:large subunit ribosomal protein L11